MSEDKSDENEAVLLREERSDPRWEKMEEEIKDELLLRRGKKIPERPLAADILRFM